MVNYGGGLYFMMMKLSSVLLTPNGMQTSGSLESCFMSSTLCAVNNGYNNVKPPNKVSADDSYNNVNASMWIDCSNHTGVNHSQIND